MATRAALITSILLASSACTEIPTASNGTPFGSVNQEIYVRGLDLEFYELAARVPGGFGGYYLKNGDIEVRLRDHT